mmetsp:Transcript_8325/g.33726  ORF Transcript_8325/g.33726 Transcript_8325/m.33726 type:complete len:270 (-) Transcript_8325:660-1469(-)
MYGRDALVDLGARHRRRRVEAIVVGIRALRKTSLQLDQRQIGIAVVPKHIDALRGHPSQGAARAALALQAELRQPEGAAAAEAVHAVVRRQREEPALPLGIADETRTADAPPHDQLEDPSRHLFPAVALVARDVDLALRGLAHPRAGQAHVAELGVEVVDYVEKLQRGHAPGVCGPRAAHVLEQHLIADGLRQDGARRRSVRVGHRAHGRVAEHGATGRVHGGSEHGAPTQRRVRHAHGQRDGPRRAHQQAQQGRCSQIHVHVVLPGGV